MIHVRTAYLDHDAIVRKGRYHDASIALVLEDPSTGERLAKATVCMSELGAKPAEGRVFIKDYAQNAGMCLRPCRTRSALPHPREPSPAVGAARSRARPEVTLGLLGGGHLLAQLP